MMGQVVSLEEARARRTPHACGKAKCMTCGFKWRAIAPLGVLWLECPRCHTDMGRFLGHTPPPAARWVCLCENDLYYVTSTGVYCPNCGEEQHGF